MRTVVLRALDETRRTLTCHSDVRSAKVAEVAVFSRSAWLFYDRKLKLQFRLAGHSAVHHGDARAAERWRASNLSSRRRYCTTQPPGFILNEPGDGLRAELRDRAPSLEEIECDGRPHFAVIDTTVDSIDWLWLNSQGHRRARFRWESGEWHGCWTVP